MRSLLASSLEDLERVGFDPEVFRDVVADLLARDREAG